MTTHDELTTLLFDMLTQRVVSKPIPLVPVTWCTLCKTYTSVALGGPHQHLPGCVLSLSLPELMEAQRREHKAQALEEVVEMIETTINVPRGDIRLGTAGLLRDLADWLILRAAKIRDWK